MAVSASSAAVVAPSTIPPQRTLLGPGPSDVPARVLEALGRPTIGHLDPVFLQIMDDVRSKLRQVFRTQNEMTLAVSSSGKIFGYTIGNDVSSRDIEGATGCLRYDTKRVEAK